MTATYGLTGGVASGKSTVSDMFQALGVPVIDADVIARALLEKDDAIKQRIIQHFGTQLLLADGEINRVKLRQLIFNDMQAKRWLEQCLHPTIRRQIASLRQQNLGPYQILVIPLLIENIDYYRDLDGIIVVDVDKTTQKQRLQMRDNQALDISSKMIAAQADRKTRLAHADFILQNDTSLASLKQQVLALHERLLQAHSSKN